ncbi:hypothetical protein B6U99_02910 [Candidatus Geothermarchaeota archaeon ex4572_27]|nr:MAG: hypothetical protein B6U99_02910 [Candidatus Geothermarchaeota archaeon ex4572_27]
MRRISGLLFGTAGVPVSTPGLDAMELEFVRGVRMSDELACKVRAVSEEAGVVLTAHAPYYVNLNSPDEGKVEASIRRILDTARVAYKAGGWSIVFHAAYYGGDEPEVVYGRVRDALKRIVSTLRDEGVEVWIRPETMGGLSEFGTLDEVLRLSEEIEMVMPCIDFAHLHARSIGGYNSYEEISGILAEVERRLGREALKSMHMHFSGIEYGEKGEIRHVNLSESDFNYEALVRALKDYSVEGVIISESPNIEEDAVMLKRLYQSI